MSTISEPLFLVAIFFHCLCAISSSATLTQAHGVISVSQVFSHLFALGESFLLVPHLDSFWKQSMALRILLHFSLDFRHMRPNINGISNNKKGRP